MMMITLCLWYHFYFIYIYKAPMSQGYIKETRVDDKTAAKKGYEIWCKGSLCYWPNCYKIKI